MNDLVGTAWVLELGQAKSLELIIPLCHFDDPRGSGTSVPMMRCAILFKNGWSFHNVGATNFDLFFKQIA